MPRNVILKPYFLMPYNSDCILNHSTLAAVVQTSEAMQNLHHSTWNQEILYADKILKGRTNFNRTILWLIKI
jgi:hypothetical protein